MHYLYIMYSPTLDCYYQWKEKYEYEGFEGLKNHRRRIEPELCKLRKENQQLKHLVAYRELEISIQADHLKKNSPKPEYKRMIASNYINQGYPVGKVLVCCSLSHSSYYYRKRSGKPGRKPSHIYIPEVDSRLCWEPPCAGVFARSRLKNCLLRFAAGIGYGSK